MTSSSAVPEANKFRGSTIVSSSSSPKDANKDKKTSSTPAKDVNKDGSKDKSAGGNEEGSAGFQTRAIPDTPDARLAVHELPRPDESISSEHTSISPPEEGSDGPLLLALLMGNNNNNANAAAQPAPQPAPQADTLDARFAVHELLGSRGSDASHEDGPLLLTLLLTNQNQNLSPQKHLMEPVPDTLDSRLAVTEVTRSRDNGTPPVLKIRGAVQNLVLTDGQVQFYKDNGYLVVPDALPNQTVANLLQCVHESAEAIATGGPGVRKQVFNGWDKGCVNPNGRVIAALTERAFKPDTTPLQYIQRLGCGVHRVLHPFRRAIMSAQHMEIARSLGYTDPRVVQSLVIVKAAQVGGKVVPHQDGCASFTDPPSCTTFWYALEDANSNNGCLSVAAGSHLVTPIISRFRKDEKGLPKSEALEKPIFAHVPGVSANASAPERDEKEDLVFRELEVKAGTLVLMHSNLMHTSAANQSGKSRVAFNFAVVDGGLEWKEDNYLQPYEGMTEFERLHVC